MQTITLFLNRITRFNLSICKTWRNEVFDVILNPDFYSSLKLILSLFPPTYTDLYLIKNITQIISNTFVGRVTFLSWRMCCRFHLEFARKIDGILNSFLQIMEDILLFDFEEYFHPQYMDSNVKGEQFCVQTALLQLILGHTNIDMNLDSYVWNQIKWTVKFSFPDNDDFLLSSK